MIVRATMHSPILSRCLSTAATYRSKYEAVAQSERAQKCQVWLLLPVALITCGVGLAHMFPEIASVLLPPAEASSEIAPRSTGLASSCREGTPAVEVSLDGSLVRPGLDCGMITPR